MAKKYKNRVKINVTKDIIDSAFFMENGVEGLSYSCRCPVALAAAIAGLDSPAFNTDTISFWDGESVKIVKAPNVASRFAWDFDEALISMKSKKRSKLKPFSFYLEW